MGSKDTDISVENSKAQRAWSQRRFAFQLCPGLDRFMCTSWDFLGIGPKSEHKIMYVSHALSTHSLGNLTIFLICLFCQTPRLRWGMESSPCGSLSTLQKLQVLNSLALSVWMRGHVECIFPVLGWPALLTSMYKTTRTFCCGKCAWEY